MIMNFSMGYYISVYYFHSVVREVSESRIKSFFDHISRLEWGYGRNFAEGIFTDDTDWNWGVPFEEALETVSDKSYVALRFDNEEIDGHVSFSNDFTSIKIDAAHFKNVEKFHRDGDKTSKEVIQLIKHLCAGLDFNWMRGGRDDEIDPFVEEFNPKENLGWVNYIHGVPTEEFDLSLCYEAEEIDGGVFIATRLNPRNRPENVKKSKI